MELGVKMAIDTGRRKELGSSREQLSLDSRPQGICFAALSLAPGEVVLH